MKQDRATPIAPQDAPLSAWLRRANREVRLVAEPISTDLLGSAFCYYALTEQGVLASGSVRALCARLGHVRLNPLALCEALAFGFTLRDETVVAEVRSIPPHATLYPDGRIELGAPPRATSAIGDAAVAVARMRVALEDVVATCEPLGPVHLCGFTGGRDSRILAALPRRWPERWHWLSVSGPDDAEARGSRRYAQQLGLTGYRWVEWTADFLDGGGGGRGEPGHRVSADLADGVGAVSDFTLLRSYFEDHRAALDEPVMLWTGALADGLLAGTWLGPPADTVWDALAPRTAHLPAVVEPAVLAEFNDMGAWYRGNPLPMEASGDNLGRLIRTLTRGRSYICRSLASFDRVCATQVNPYVHPALVELGLEVDPRLLASDALRGGVLAALGPDLDGPSAYGYRAPRYADRVHAALAHEAGRCGPLERVLRPELLAAIRDARFPVLEGAVVTPAGPSYRTSDEPAAVWRSLRDYEHLLTYASFLNLLVDDGVNIA